MTIYRVDVSLVAAHHIGAHIRPSFCYVFGPFRESRHSGDSQHSVNWARSGLAAAQSNARLQSHLKVGSHRRAISVSHLQRKSGSRPSSLPGARFAARCMNGRFGVGCCNRHAAPPSDCFAAPCEPCNLHHLRRSSASAPYPSRPAMRSALLSIISAACSTYPGVTPGRLATAPATAMRLATMASTRSCTLWRRSVGR